MKKVLLSLIVFVSCSFAGFWTIGEHQVAAKSVEGIAYSYEIQNTALHEKNIYVIYEEEDKSIEYFVRSHDLGLTWSEPVELETDENVIAVDEVTGKVTIVGELGNVKLSIFSSTDSGKTFTEPKVLIEDTRIANYLMQLFVNGDDIFVFWMQYRDGTIFTVKSSDGGETFSDPIPVSSSESKAVTAWMDIELVDNGNIYVTWVDERDLTTYPYIAISSDGGETFEETKLTQTVNGSADERVYSLACEEYEGSLFIYYTRYPGSGSGIYEYILKSTDGGKTFEDPFALEGTVTTIYEPDFSIERDIIHLNGGIYDLHFNYQYHIRKGFPDVVSTIEDDKFVGTGDNRIFCYAGGGNSGRMNFFVAPVTWVNEEYPSITLTAPEDQSVFGPGTPVTISWESKGALPKVTIKAEHNDEEIIIAEDIENSGSYDWTAFADTTTNWYSDLIVEGVSPHDSDIVVLAEQRFIISTIEPILTTAKIKENSFVLRNNTLTVPSTAPYTVEIFSANSQLLKKFSGTERTVSLNNLNVASGIYQIRVIQQAEVFTGQFIVK